MHVLLCFWLRSSSNLGIFFVADLLLYLIVKSFVHLQNMETQQMEIDTDPLVGDGTKPLKNVVASGIEVALHPMVILNISECHTRMMVQNPSKNMPLFGALLGKHQGRKIEILNSYELLFKKNDAQNNKDSKSGDNLDSSNEFDVEFSDKNSESDAHAGPDLNSLEIDQDYFETKIEQYKQVFPDYELVGWFTIGEGIDQFDKDMFRKVGDIHGKCSEKFSENPLVLKLNPSKSCSKTLPVKVYESYLKSVDNVPSSSSLGVSALSEVCFNEVSVSLETEDGEKIVLDHVAENQNSSGRVGNPSVAERLRIQSRAVRMLRDRVKLILEFVEDAKRNNIQVDQDILRQISFIANRLPMCSTKGRFEDDFNIQLNDNALLLYLGTLTKCSATMNKFVSRLSSFMPDRVIRRRQF